jgi:hypothetical protein
MQTLSRVLAHNLTQTLVYSQILRGNLDIKQLIQQAALHE